MKQRLYNENGADTTEHGTEIDRIAQDAVISAMKYADEHNLDWRDVESVFNSSAGIIFAHIILKKALLRKKKEENANKT